jgi:hypothetical protein
MLEMRTFGNIAIPVLRLTYWTGTYSFWHEKIFFMSDFIPQKPAGVKIAGLGPKAQKLQALREKAAQQKNGKNFAEAGSSTKARTSSAPPKKTAFQRKAT